MKPRVALIIPYFGVLPHYFAYFVKSIATSPILELLLFTDAEICVPLPKNVTVHRSSLSEFNELASRAVSVPVTSTNPYKICDFRPAFGKVFQEYLRDFEFWAFGDIDLVYGDIAAFLEPLLHDHDVISCRSGWISGSLCVLRNCGKVNELYRLSKDWQIVFTSPDPKLFDEMGGHLYQEVLKGADVLSLAGAVESFTHVVKRLAKEGSLRCAFHDLACEGIPWGETIDYNAGKLMRSSDGSQLMYLHYVVMKRRYFELPKVSRVPDHFFIRRTGVYLKRPDIRTVCSVEVERVLRGSIHASRRLLRRYIGEQL